MEPDSAARTAEAKVIGVKAWPAYIGVFVLAMVGFFLALPLVSIYGNELTAFAVLLVTALLVGYRYLAVRSVQLYYDDAGVWVVSGILPWTRGVSGVKWRDMDEASYDQGFVSWATRSWTVRIRHRFTKSSEIVLLNMADGRRAVETINAIHQQMLRSGAVD